MESTRKPPEIRRRPLTADLLGSRTEVSAANLPAVVRIFGLAGQALGALLREFSSVDVKVSLDAITEVGGAGIDPDAVECCFVANGSPIDARIACDRNLAMILCELAFGGSSDEPPCEGEDRPLSRIETALRQLAIGEFADRLPVILKEALGVEVKRLSDQGQSESPQPHESDRICGKLLVNVFGYSGELRVDLDRRRLIDLAAPSSRRASTASVGLSSPTLRANLEQSETVLELRLRPQVMTYADIADLRIGQLLKLSMTADDPVALVSGGEHLFAARLVRPASRVTARIVAS